MKRRWGANLSPHDRLQAIILIHWCRAAAADRRWIYLRHTQPAYP